MSTFQLTDLLPQPVHEPADVVLSDDRTLPGRRPPAAVAVHDDVRRQHAHQLVHVPVTEGGEEPASQLIPSNTGASNRGFPPGDVVAHPGDELAAVRLALADDARDLNEAVREDVAQQEDSALDGRQPFQQQERSRPVPGGCSSTSTARCAHRESSEGSTEVQRSIIAPPNRCRKGTGLGTRARDGQPVLAIDRCSGSFKLFRRRAEARHVGNRLRPVSSLLRRPRWSTRSRCRASTERGTR